MMVAFGLPKIRVDDGKWFKERPFLSVVVVVVVVRMRITLEGIVVVVIE